MFLWSPPPTPMGITIMSSPALLCKNINCMRLSFTKSGSNRRNVMKLLGEEKSRSRSKSGGLSGGPGEGPCLPPGRSVSAGMSHPGCGQPLVLKLSPLEIPYILKIYLGPPEGLFTWVIAVDIRHIRNQHLRNLKKY